MADAMRRADQERMDRDREHARLLFAFAVERVEGIDDVLAEGGGRRALAVDQADIVDIDRIRNNVEAVLHLEGLIVGGAPIADIFDAVRRERVESARSFRQTRAEPATDALPG